MYSICSTSIVVTAVSAVVMAMSLMLYNAAAQRFAHKSFVLVAAKMVVSWLDIMVMLIASYYLVDTFSEQILAHPLLSTVASLVTLTCCAYVAECANMWPIVWIAAVGNTLTMFYSDRVQYPAACCGGNSVIQ